MDNHYHLFIQTPDASLVKGRKWFQNTVTRRFIVRHREWGRLFGDRYKAVVVEGESPYYYETLWDYIHLKPSRVGIADVRQGQSVLDYPWSSLAGSKACRRNSCEASQIDFEVVEIDLEHTENHFERAKNDLAQARND